MRDIWNNEYVCDGFIVTFLTEAPEHIVEHKYDFLVEEDGETTTLSVTDKSLLYDIKALKPIKGKTVCIKEIDEGRCYFTAKEIKDE